MITHMSFSLLGLHQIQNIEQTKKIHRTQNDKNLVF